MIGSLIVYAGLVLAVAALIFAVMPRAWPRGPLGRARRRHRVAALGIGLAVAATGLVLPAYESRSASVATRLDAFAPAWQFREVHRRHIDAPPARVYDALKEIRADEILLFRTLTWIRRAGRPLPQSILSAGTDKPLLELVTPGFLQLADDRPRELVMGTVVMRPPGTPTPLTPQTFQMPLPPGFALATMNFVIEADGPNASVISTETRVFANSPSARRRFAAYWRVIYPGSALIRRMWLRAVERRAMQFS